MEQNKNLTDEEEREMLRKLLCAKIGTFQGTLGRCKGKLIGVKRKEGTKSCYFKLYKIPKVIEDTTKKSVQSRYSRSNEKI